MIDLGAYGTWPGTYVDVHPEEWPQLVQHLQDGTPHPMLDHLVGVPVRFTTTPGEEPHA